MRIDLNCPYAEKDQAKALGARWDVARKVWYIVDIEDLTPFMRWIKRESHLKPSNPSADQMRHKRKVKKRKRAAKHKKTRKPPAHKSAHHGVNQLAPVVTKSIYVPQCGCYHIPLWEDCEHTEAAANAAMREMLALT